MGKFADAVAAWAQAEEQGMLDVSIAATLELVAVIKTPVGAGGHMPVDTSYLQNSLDASYTTPPQVRPQFDGSGPVMSGLSLRVESLIRGMKIGQTIHFGFVSTYAARQNYGFTGTDSMGRTYNQSGHHFVELGLQRWPELVAKHVGARSAN